MRINELKDKQIVIFGFGREGEVTLEVLKNKLPGADISVVDDRPTNISESAELLPTIERASANTIVIKSPGIPWHNSAIKSFQDKGATITSATNLFFSERKNRGTIVGVTGTKGKSTTASLLAHTLKIGGLPVVLAGNVGVPMLSMIDKPDETIFVLELSSYMLADLEVGPDIAIVLNLYEEHMDYHGTVDEYQQAKMNIGLKQEAGDLFIYNDQFPSLVELSKKVASRAMPFHRADDALLDSLLIKGEHNKENASAVLLVVRSLGVADDKIHDAFASFKPLPHRLEEVGETAGVLYVNDSISTTPQSALAAIEVYADRLGGIILGGKDRGYDFSTLAKRLKTLPHAAIFILPGGDRVAGALEREHVGHDHVESLEEAVSSCRKLLPAGTVCLMSPASPSYGYFKNFEERGEAFKKAVSTHK